MYFNYNCYVYVHIIVVCVKVFGQINSNHHIRTTRYPTKLINSPAYHQYTDAYNQYVRPKQIFAETPPTLRSRPYLLHDDNHNQVDEQYYNLRDTQAFQRGENPYFGLNRVNRLKSVNRNQQHLPKPRNVQRIKYSTGHLLNKPNKEQYHKKSEEIHRFHTHSAIINEGGPHSVQKKTISDTTDPDRFYFKAHLKNNNKNPQKKSEHQNQSKNQLLQTGPLNRFNNKDRNQVYNTYNNNAAKNQQNIKSNYNQNGHWNKDLYLSKSDVHQNNQKLEKQPNIREQNNKGVQKPRIGTTAKYNHHKSSGYQYNKKNAKLPTSINDMLNHIPRKHLHNSNAHPSPRVEYNQNIGNKNRNNNRIQSHPKSDAPNKLKHNAKQKQKFSHQSISVRPLIFKQNQQEFPLEKSDAIKKKKESNNVSKKSAPKQQKPNNIKRSKEPYKKTVALIREFTAIMPSDDDDDFSSLSLIDTTPEFTTSAPVKKPRKKQKQTKVDRQDFYDDYEAPPKQDDDEDMIKPVGEREEEEDTSEKPKKNTENSDHEEYQKKSDELRRLMQEDLSNKLYDDEEEEELSKPDNVEKGEKKAPKTVKNQNNKKANNFEKEVDISADDLERYFDKEFTSFHSDKVDNSDIKPEVEEIEVSIQPMKPEQTEEVYGEEGDDHQFKGKNNFKSEFESEKPSEQKPENKKSIKVSQKADHLENESEPEYKTSSDFLQSHDDFLNRIDKENDKFRKDTEEKVNNSGKDEKDEEDSGDTNGDANGETKAKNENEDESEDDSDKKEEEEAETETEAEAEPAEDESKTNKENNEESEDSSANNDDSKEKAKNENEDEDETEESKEDTSEKDSDQNENNDSEESNDKTEEKVEKNEENERNEENGQKPDNNAIKQNDAINEEYSGNEDNNNNDKCLDASKCNGDNADNADNADNVDNADNAPKQLDANDFQMKINDNININNNNPNIIQNMIPVSEVIANTESPPLTHNHQSYQTSLNPMPISMPYPENEMLHQSKHLDDAHLSPELAMNPLPYYVDLQRINFNNGNILNAQKHNFVSDIDNQRVIYDNMQK